MAQIPLEDWSRHLSLAERAIEARLQYGQQSREYEEAHQACAGSLAVLRKRIDEERA